MFHLFLFLMVRWPHCLLKALNVTSGDLFSKKWRFTVLENLVFKYNYLNFWKNCFRYVILKFVQLMLMLPSVLWCCWLGSMKGIRPLKTEWWGVGVVISLEWGSDLYMAQMMPLPLAVSCFSKIPIGFTFLVLAHLGSPGKGPSNMGVCVMLNK